VDDQDVGDAGGSVLPVRGATRLDLELVEPAVEVAKPLRAVSQIPKRSRFARRNSM